jgi:Domain of Unknown Function (DUF1080)
MKRFALAFFLLTQFGIVNSQKNNNDWKQLFDGTSLSGWKKVAGAAEYKVVNGVIEGSTVPNTPNTFLITEKEYSDFILELDVRIEDTTSNSGIQFRSQYDANGNNGKGKVYGYQYELDPSVRQWTAGVYDEGRRDWLYPLSLNASAQKILKTGVYNKVKIECIGNTIKTWINDVPAAYVVDDVDRKGVVALQVHSITKPEMAGKKIFWKNIRIKEGINKPTDFPASIYVLNTNPNQLSDFEQRAGWKLLFDGKTGNGWRGAYKKGFPEKGWEIKDGTLNVLASTGGESVNGGDIVSADTYGFFDLSFEFKLSKKANSGVKYFVTLSENNQGSAIGLEYQILDDSLHPDAKAGRNGNRTMASLYDMIKAEKTSRFIKQPGGWNTGRVIVYPNNHVEHYLNGIKVLEYDRGSVAYRELVSISKYKIWPAFGESKTGHILLQDHGDAVSFRSIKIKKLD